MMQHYKANCHVWEGLGKAAEKVAPTGLGYCRSGQLFLSAGHISVKAKKIAFAGRIWPADRMLPPPWCDNIFPGTAGFHYGRRNETLFDRNIQCSLLGNWIHHFEFFALKSPQFFADELLVWERGWVSWCIGVFIARYKYFENVELVKVKAHSTYVFYVKMLLKYLFGQKYTYNL